MTKSTINVNHFEHFFFLDYSLFKSILIGSFLALQTPTFVNPVVTTGNHKNISKIYRRYLATAIHMLTWFLEDPFDPESSAYRSFNQVRSMHMKLFLSMNTHNKNHGVDKLDSSLHDMIMAMFPFIGLLINYPIACGAHGITQHEKDQIIYTWRVIGHAMGIDDQYNICNGSADDFSQLYKQFERDFFIPLLSKVPNETPLGWRLSQGYIIALNRLDFTLNFNCILYYWFNIIGVPVTIKLNLYEWTIMMVNHFISNFLLRFRFFYNLINNHVRSKIDQHKQIRESVSNDLNQLYSHINYVPSCPVNQDPDYRDDFID